MGLNSILSSVVTWFNFNLISTWVIAASTGFLTLVAGEAAHTFQILLTIMAINMTIGLISSVKYNNVKSHLMEKEILIKFAMILGILFAGQLDLLTAEVGFKGFITIGEDNVTLTVAAIFAFIGSESVSTLEKLDKLGVVLPQQIKTVVASMNSKKQEKEQEKQETIEEKVSDSTQNTGGNL